MGLPSFLFTRRMGLWGCVWIIEPSTRWRWKIDTCCFGLMTCLINFREPKCLVGLTYVPGITKFELHKEMKNWAHKLNFILPGVQESVREWTPTSPNELPLWELESQWISKFVKGNFRNQNSLNWKVHYIIGKLLKFRCLKLAFMTDLST